MNVVVVLLTIVEVICSLLLILLVLLQRSRDEGMGMAFGGAMGESLFGAQAATILTKGTVVIAVVFMLNTVMLDRLYSSGTRASSSDDILDRLSVPAAPVAPPVEAAPESIQEEVPVVPAAELPAAPAVSVPVQDVAPEASAPAPAAVPAT